MPEMRQWRFRHPRSTPDVNETAIVLASFKKV